MGRGQKRLLEIAEDHETNEGAEQAPEEDDEPRNRRHDMADIARRRAAHFAHFQADEDEDANTPHTGGSEARKLGPWSSAMELIEARAAAATARQGRILAKALDMGTEDIEWSPARNPKLGARPQSAVPSLYKSCINLLVKHIDDVETLWGIPELIRTQLAAELSAQRMMSSKVAALLTDGGPDEVILPDCTQLKEEDMIAVLAPAVSPQLETLKLNLCGRGFGDPAASALLLHSSLPGLRILALGGAYRLTDIGLTRILRECPQLQALHLPQCSRIEGIALQKLPSFASQLRVLDLADCRGLSKQALYQILCTKSSLHQIEALVLDSIPEVDDDLIASICSSLPSLLRLSLKLCVKMSDRGLNGIATGCGPRLTELRLDEVTKITDVGLEALGHFCPNVQVLTVRRCSKISDLGLGNVISAGQLRVLGADQLHSITNLTVKALIATCSEKLEEADFSWCRGIKGAALGLLVDSCPNLKKLTVFGCSQIGKEFLHGHGNPELTVVGATEQRTGLPEVIELRLIDQDEQREMS